MNIPKLFVSSVALVAVLFCARAFAVDADAAKDLAKQSKCTTCHSVSKKKDGPSYKEIAAKYKGQADAAEKLYTHLSTSPKIKVDGKEETHASPKTSEQAAVKNLVAWILAQ